MDPDAGIHMSYDMVTPVYPDHPTHIDIHCKGRSFYRLDSVVGLEAYDSIALIMDGQRYRLNEEDKTYIVYEDYMNLHPHAVLIRVLWRWYQKNIGL